MTYYTPNPAQSRISFRHSEAFMNIFGIGFETALACCLAVAGPAWAAPVQDQPGRQKEDTIKAENNKGGAKKSLPAPPAVNPDFRVIVEDMKSLPVDTAPD